METVRAKSASPDLFGAPLLPGLRYRDALITPNEEDCLIAHVEQIHLTPFRFQGWLGKRLTMSFGWHYDFDTGRFGETDPLPHWLLPLKARAATFAGLPNQQLVQALLIKYDPGAAIGWHRDRPLFEDVIGISLGAAATMRFRQRSEQGFHRVFAPLAPRSAYHLAGEARHYWEHSIAPMDATRWSITFRSFASGR